MIFIVPQDVQVSLQSKDNALLEYNHILVDVQLCQLVGQETKSKSKLKIKTMTSIKCLRHDSLQMNVMTNCAKFRTWVFGSKWAWDILVQKIKVKILPLLQAIACVIPMRFCRHIVLS